MADIDRNQLIATYFNLGYNYKEILGYLLGIHHVILSLRQLKRILASLGLFRRKYKTSTPVLSGIIRDEVSGAGCNLGYRAMHHKLQVVHGIRTSRESIRKIIKEVDPEGVEARSQHRLKRRRYICKGPNYNWHIDGYDKLKPYGFCVHGCIDGYSRKILWLHVSSTNNDPKLIAHYYLKCVSLLGGTARRIRSDRGTENVNIEALQKLFRSDCNDAFAGEKSFMYGKSTSNQRIEAYWGKLRQSTAQFWMDLFKDMTESGELDDIEFARECILFCFSDLIQDGLDKAVLLHNSHRIRPYTYQECPSGKPDLIFHLPEAYGSSDYLVHVDRTDIDMGKTMATVPKKTYGCSDGFAELFEELMQVYDLDRPDDSVQARKLYNRLMGEVSSL